MHFSHKGFTLTELLTVIAIIGILSAIAIPSFTTSRQKARDTRRIADIKQIQISLELYRSACNGNYPSSLTDTANNGCLSGVSLSNFLKPIPKDPITTNGNYIYGTNTTIGYYLGAILELSQNQELGNDADYVLPGVFNGASANCSSGSPDSCYDVVP